MSMRTIVEFNHDYTHKVVENGPEFIAWLRIALNGGDEESWERLRPFGVRRAVMSHHSANSKVVVDGRDYYFPGDAPAASIRSHGGGK